MLFFFHLLNFNTTLKKTNHFISRHHFYGSYSINFQHTTTIREYSPNKTKRFSFLFFLKKFDFFYFFLLLLEVDAADLNSKLQLNASLQTYFFQSDNFLFFFYLIFFIPQISSFCCIFFLFLYFLFNGNLFVYNL